MNKKLILYAVICLMFISLTACGKGDEKNAITIDISSAATTLMDGIKFSDVLTAIDADSLSIMYNIDTTDFSNCAIYASTGATAEEIAIFEAIDIDAAKRIKAAFEDRVASQKVSFENYVPAEMDKLNHAIIIAHDKYVFLCITDSYDTADKIIKDIIK